MDLGKTQSTQTFETNSLIVFIAANFDEKIEREILLSLKILQCHIIGHVRVSRNNSSTVQ
jgi:hypothetical protein